MTIDISIYCTNAHGDIFFVDCIQSAIEIIDTIRSAIPLPNDKIVLKVHDIRLCGQVYPVGHSHYAQQTDKAKGLRVSRKSISKESPTMLLRERRVVSGNSLSVIVYEHVLNENWTPRWVRWYFYLRSVVDVFLSRLARNISVTLATRLATSAGYSGISLGDLVASFNARVYPHRSGQLSFDGYFLNGLYGARLSAFILDRIPLDQVAYNFSFSSEGPYIHSILPRILSLRGVYTLGSTWNAKVGCYNIKCKNALWLPPAPQASPLDITTDFARVHAYMQQRFSDSYDPLGYMHLGKNSNQETFIRDFQGRIIEISDSMLYVVVFLHSVDDGLYINGVTPFGDMISWARHTIAQCRKNPFIGHILIKAHPSIAYESGPNRRFVDNLAKELQSDDKCTLISPRSSTLCLAKIPSVIGVTSHGSIAEEFSYLGRTMVGSTYAPWGDNYGFLIVWKSVGDYNQILGGLSTQSRSRLNWKERVELMRYILDYRILGQSDLSRSYSARFGAAILGKDCANLPECDLFPAANKILGSMRDWTSIIGNLQRRPSPR